MGCGGRVVGLVKKRKHEERPDRVEGRIESLIQGAAGGMTSTGSSHSGARRGCFSVHAGAARPGRAL